MAAGIDTAAIFLLIPAMALEDLVWRSGIAALVPAAQPPLGATARAALALSGGLLAGAVAWAGLFLLFGPGGFLVRKPAAGADGAPTLRRADAHPDAPARRPISASDLGVPMPPVQAAPAPAPVVQPIPADLDQPLAEFDPGAILPVPKEPVRPVTPLKAPALAEGERIASVELPRGPRASEDEPTIEALLQRLEAGARRTASR